MTLLLRLIEEPEAVKAWATHPRPEDGSVVPLAELPLWAVREFVPTKRDGVGLSVFEIAGEQDANLVAAAFAFSSAKIDAGRYVFAVADKTQVTDAGIELISKPGTTGHSVVDSLHREIILTTVESVMTATSVFFNGDAISIEGKVASTAAKDSARLDQFNYIPLTNRSFEGNWQAKNLIVFLKHGAVSIHGVAAPNSPKVKPIVATVAPKTA